jgi:hypothetical protein
MKKPTIYALIITVVVIGVWGGLDYFSKPETTLVNIDFCEEKVPSESKENSFVLHADGVDFKKVNDFGVESRLIAGSENYEFGIKRMDEIVVNYDKSPIITLRLSAGRPDEQTHAHCIPDNIEPWTKVVENIVERYDGDSDFGTLPIAEKTKQAILDKPIKYWQVENEPLWQLHHCPDGEEPTKFTKEELVNHLRTLSAAIKNQDSDANVISGGLTGLVVLLLSDGYTTNDFIEIGHTDCGYKKIYKSDIKNAAKEKLLELENFREKVKYFLVEGAPYYDVIDFHHYENEALDIAAKFEWINDVLKENNIRGKEIITLENAGPYFFFPLMGKSKPSHKEKCPMSGPDPERYFNDEILSSQLVKNHAIGFASGVKKFAWSTLYPTLSWSDNYVRTALIEPDMKTKKPAFYTYKLMVDKLRDFTKAEKIQNNIYKFYFSDKSPVFVLWGEDEEAELDMKSYIKSDKALVTHIITRKTQIQLETKVVSSVSIPVDEIPIFVENYNCVESNVN